MLEVKRTLVKSGPELWAEVSDPEALSGHLAPFGPIRITRTADDSLVHWEGERVQGQLTLEPSGFGTRVVMSLDMADAPAPAPTVVATAPTHARRGGLFSRLLRRPPAPAPVAPAPAPAPAPVGAADPVMSDDDARAALTSVLDHLGTAHHRPFTRS